MSTARPADGFHTKTLAVADDFPRVRIDRDARLQKLVDDGRLVSPTFRGIVDRLNRSDVVVYLRCQAGSKRREDGLLTFVGAAGGYRYVQARVRFVTAWARQVALIGHELFHAVEVADAPGVVDDESFEREYRRIGFVSRAGSIGLGIAYDTHAATRTGDQILRELAGGSPPSRLALNGASDATR